MNLFLLNIFLSIGFSAVLGQFNLSGFLSGFFVGYMALWLTKPLYGPTRYFERLPKVIGLISFFAKELLVSNLRVLWDVITPTHISRPGIIGIPLDARTFVTIKDDAEWEYVHLYRVEGDKLVLIDSVAVRQDHQVDRIIEFRRTAIEKRKSSCCCG